MNINEKINYNYENSEFIVLFKNRRFKQIGGWVYDSIMFLNVRKEFKEHVMKKALEMGLKEG